MEKTQHMRLLTEQELGSIYGGNIFESIWNWSKKYVFVRTNEKDPRVEGGFSFKF